MFYKLVMLILFLVLSSPVHAQPVQEVLDEITFRGRLLAEYDRVAGMGTDVVMASKPNEALNNQYIAQKIGKEWVVVFGKLNETRDAFTVNYKYTNDLGLAKEQRLPYDDTEFYYQSAMVIDRAWEAFNKTNKYQRPFNTAVLPNGDNYYVYIYPAQTKEHVYPLGGDWRYLVSGRTFEILETRQMHKTILEPDSSKADKVVSGFHTVLNEVPEDTDVLNVLTRKPRVPEYVATINHMYRIETDGAIKYLGLVKDALGE